ncbi:MAG: amidase domain-containing protein [Paeniclostridium sp.]|uniref:Amidase domain-containing protein n=1 Tax=Paeniclostridium hominis TaxID=2764329 RepID=A0ABR7K3S6_9FIRM|nr:MULTISPECIES: amidase domain-containing protein [Paeniclostridium]MBC6003762.1 amidase domain-containing protein [Paeniclostridium hominis]MBC8632677.1 amidase domain-containing protein [[Eubacterium] tenue]MDU1538999.1 amidase domain-containing protein [Paeniclostridium sordellii]MDU2591640.1 amidase domain-containing protein [Paeniclostridium sordellii]
MNSRKEKNKKIRKILVLVGVFIISTITLIQANKENINTFIRKGASTKLEEDSEISKFQLLLENLFDNRNKAILTKNDEVLKKLYDIDHKFGLWAYEQEVTKMKYLENWSYKQGVKFNDIKTRVKVRKVKEKEENLYGIICAVSTEYNYSYENQLDTKNMFRIGTYHYLNMRIVDNEYVITKEWYTDPFADSLHLDNIKSDDIRNYILSKENQPISLTNEQTKAMEYAHKYCGAAADEEHGMKFNPKYKDFNPDGGDCANFASQIMYESKRFKKNRIWNYEGNSGTKAWVNAQGFKNYLLNSGRGSLISKGSYEDVYKTAYNMRPGDIVAYEKGGRITHVSTVTGLDSRGYPLVTCHNTDRLLVPWDLGWSDKSIRFHLIKVHY